MKKLGNLGQNNTIFVIGSNFSVLTYNSYLQWCYCYTYESTPVFIIFKYLFSLRFIFTRLLCRKYCLKILTFSTTKIRHRK